MQSPRKSLRIVLSHPPHQHPQFSLIKRMSALPKSSIFISMISYLALISLQLI